MTVELLCVAVCVDDGEILLVVLSDGGVSDTRLDAVVNMMCRWEWSAGGERRCGRNGLHSESWLKNGESITSVADCYCHGCFNCLNVAWNLCWQTQAIHLPGIGCRWVWRGIRHNVGGGLQLNMNWWTSSWTLVFWHKVKKITAHSVMWHKAKDSVLYIV